MDTSTGSSDTSVNVTSYQCDSLRSLQKAAERSGSSLLSNLLYSAAESENPKSTKFAQLIDSAVETLQSFETIEIHKHHFTLTFNPEVGKVHSAFSLITSGNASNPPRPSSELKVKDLKKALLANEGGLHQLLDITTENASFDKIYSHLLEMDGEGKIDLDSFTDLFAPTYAPYLSYINLEKVLPPDFSNEEGKMDRAALTAFYEKNVFAAHLAKQISKTSIATMIESLPDISISRR